MLFKHIFIPFETKVRRYFQKKGRSYGDNHSHKLETLWLYCKRSRQTLQSLFKKWMQVCSMISNMRKCRPWSIVLCGWSDVASLCHVSEDLGLWSVNTDVTLTRSRAAWKRPSELADWPRETTWVTSNSWVHTSGNQNATPPLSASLRTFTPRAKNTTDSAKVSLFSLSSFRENVSQNLS